MTHDHQNQDLLWEKWSILWQDNTVKSGLMMPWGNIFGSQAFSWFLTSIPVLLLMLGGKLDVNLKLEAVSNTKPSIITEIEHQDSKMW
jgi:hypothetical protein